MKQPTRLSIIVLGVVLFAVPVLANTPPIASFEIHASSDGSQTTVVLDASSSYDPDGTIVVYGWNFGDESTGSGMVKTHTFPSQGTYTVTLNVFDNAGASQLTSQTIDLTKPLTPETSPGADAANVVVPLDIPVGYRVGERAPAFALPDQDGDVFQLSDFLGHVVLIEFWSSSCSACQASMPHLEDLYEEYADLGVVFITISINRNAEDAWKFLQQNGYTHFVSLREADLANRPTMEAYDVSRIPQAFLIDERGVIQFAGHINYVQEDTIDAVL